MPSNFKPKGLFLNPAKANCSIHESGRMVYDCLKLSDRYDIDYIEVSGNHRQISTGYDFYAFNYHPITMGWLNTQLVNRLPGLKLTFILETLRNDPFVMCPSDAFDVYCALDPTMKVADKRVYAFPRPLEPTPQMRPYQEQEIPRIGSFGFATEGKGFELVVEAVNKEFERAEIHINIPPGTYADPATFHLHNRDYAEYLIELCQKTAKDGVEVTFTRDYMDKGELIQWCGQNTLNCFLYNRNQPGLSATTDQAISSGRPLSISTNETFRHIHSYIKPYPLRGLRESISQSQSEVARLQEDWKPVNFALRFEKVLEDFYIFDKTATASSQLKTIKLAKNNPTKKIKRIVAPVARRVIVDLTPPFVLKLIPYFKKRNFTVDASLLPLKIQPFAHRLLQSHSQFNEDLLIDFLFNNQSKGFYVDVGANDPTFNSNTKRFYDRGWSGINVEPGLNPYNELCKARPRDLNLNLGVGLEAGTLTFYNIVSDPTLSSFDLEVAQRMATYFGLVINPTPIDVKPLSEILDQHIFDKTIDFMSVDAEGIDFDVIRSNDWKKYRPTLLLVEMNNQSKEIMNYLSNQEYLLIFNNEYNGLFVDLKTSNINLKSLLEKNYN